MISQGVTQSEALDELAACDLASEFDVTAREVGFYQLAFRRFRKHHLAVGSIVLLAVIAISCFLIPYVLPADFNRPHLEARLVTPNLKHLLGTDEIGRDILYRILTGGQVSIVVGLLATLVTIVIGTLLGTLSGYFGGWLDNVLMRITDAILSVPSIFLLILLSSGIAVGPFLLPGHTPLLIIVAIGVIAWPDTARIIRSVVLSLREKDFVEAARAVGSANWKIIARHILPNALGPITVSATLSIGSAILTESTLSYLGLGIGAPISSWGSTLQAAQDYIWEAPYYALFPGTMILLTVLCVNFIGDGLRDAFDPRSFER